MENSSQFISNFSSQYKYLLSEEQKNTYQEQGWIGNFPLLSKLQTEQYVRIYKNLVDRIVFPYEMHMMTDKLLFEKFWFKSLHVASADIRTLLSHPAILVKVKQILGPNILLWGSSITTRNPGESHRWHVDIEHTLWHGVTVFIGLTGASSQTALKVISHSHNSRLIPQFEAVNEDEQVLQLAKASNPKCTLVSSATGEGEFMIFDGLLWHGSSNTSSDTRYSIIAQYCRPNQETRIPLNWDFPITWSTHSAPCLLVAGNDDFGLNSLI